MATPRASKARPLEPLAKGPETTLVPLASKLATWIKRGERDIGRKLDAAARAFGARNWSALFSTFPKFRPGLDWGRSANHPALNSGIGLWHPATAQAALQSWSTAAETERTLSFELGEPGSRIYGAWNLLGRLLGLAAPVTLGYFNDWLRLYWTLRRLSIVQFPDGPMSLRCGVRSQGVFDRTKQDFADSLAFSLPWRWRRKPHPLPDAHWEKSEEVVAFVALRERIVESARGITEDARDAVPRWPTPADSYYLRTQEGIAAWTTGADKNPNTPGISAMIWRPNADSVVTCPPPSTAHIRGKKVPQTVEWDMATRRLHFTQRPPGTPHDLEVELPRGAVIYYVKHGQSGLEPAG